MHRNKKLSLFEARSCVDELGHPSKLPYDWKPTLACRVRRARRIAANIAKLPEAVIPIDSQ
jgi:hypothetical protein